MTFSLDCRRCDRLAEFLDQVGATYPGYHARPVASFGDAGSRLLIVGLAPGMHGANRTGRPFTGDYAGKLLYGTLYKLGFASHPEPLDADGHTNGKLSLVDCRIANAVRCLPPQNKPTPLEVKTCNDYLSDELAMLPDGAAVLALGTIAHQAVLGALKLRKADYAFSHGARHGLPSGIELFDSYHCSRYNTQTKRLTAAMFESVIASIAAHLGTV